MSLQNPSRQHGAIERALQVTGHDTVSGTHRHGFRQVQLSARRYRLPDVSAFLTHAGQVSRHEGTLVMTYLGPRAHDGAYSTDPAFGYRHETPEQRYTRRSRNAAVFVAVAAALVLLALLVMGFAALGALHAITSTLTGSSS
jgi:hypothetical protein